MPKYRVETDQGAYEVELDKEPSSPEELQNLVQQQLSDGKPPETPFLQAPEGEMSFKQDRPIRQMASKIYTPILEATGMIGGGIIGSGAAPIAGTVAGAGLGYAGGRSIARSLDELLGIKEPIPMKERLVKSAKDVGMGATMEMGGQVAGKVIIDPLSKMLAPMAKRFKETGGIERAELGKKYNVPLSPAEINKSKPLALAENYQRMAPGSSGMSQKFDEKQLEALSGVRQDILTKAGPAGSIESVGKEIQGAAKSNISGKEAMRAEAIKRTEDKIAGRLIQQRKPQGMEIAGKGVKSTLKKSSQKAFAASGEEYANLPIQKDDVLPLANLNKRASEMLEEYRQLPRADQDANVVMLLDELSSSTPPEVLKYIDQLPPGSDKLKDAILKEYGVAPGKPWGGVQGLLRSLNSRMRAEDQAVKMGQPGYKFQSSPEGGIAKQLKSALEADIEAYSSQTGGTLKPAFDAARKQYGERARLFGDPNLKTMLRSNPEDIFGKVVKPGNVTEIKMLRQAVGDDGIKPIKDIFTQRAIKDPALIQKYGDETLSALYNPQEINTLKTLSQRKIGIQGQQLHKEMVEKVAEMHPEVIFDSLIKSGSKKTIEHVDAENIARLHEMTPIIGQKGMAQIKSKFVERLLEPNKKGYFQPSEFVSKVYSYGPRTAQRILGKEYQEVMDLAKLSEASMGAERLAANPSGTAQNVVTAGTIGLLVANPIGGAKYILTNAGIAKLYQSQLGRKYLTEGFKLPVGTERAVGHVAKILAIAGRDGYEEMKEKEKKKDQPYSDLDRILTGAPHLAIRNHQLPTLQRPDEAGDNLLD